MLILRIHIRTFTQELFHAFNIAFAASLMECFLEYIFIYQKFINQRASIESLISINMRQK